MLPDQIRKAEVAMMKVALRAMERGAMVSKPIFEGARYDYVIEEQGKVYRVQVKYADGKTNCRTSGAVYLNLRKQIKKNKNHPYDESEIDALVVYLPKLNKVCWLVPEVFSGKQSLYIRLYCGRRLSVVIFRLPLTNRSRTSGSNSMVECQLPKLKVAGSIPVSRSKLFSA
jgi:hypothetical protein